MRSVEPVLVRVPRGCSSLDVVDAMRRAALTALPEGDVIVDLTHARSLSTRDADQFTDIARDAAHSMRLVVVATDPAVRLELVLTGLDLIVPLVRGIEDGCRAVDLEGPSP